MRARLFGEKCFQKGGGLGNVEAIAFCDGCSPLSAMVEKLQGNSTLLNGLDNGSCIGIGREVDL